MQNLWATDMRSASLSLVCMLVVVEGRGRGVWAARARARVRVCECVSVCVYVCVCVCTARMHAPCVCVCLRARVCYLPIAPVQEPAKPSVKEYSALTEVWIAQGVCVSHFVRPPLRWWFARLTLLSAKAVTMRLTLKPQLMPTVCVHR